LKKEGKKRMNYSKKWSRYLEKMTFISKTKKKKKREPQKGRKNSLPRGSCERSEKVWPTGGEIQKDAKGK